ncbi:MAG: hypothetical protein WC314_19935 [Vulcanimicrobiota bacterium]
MSAATQPFAYGGDLWCYTVDGWTFSDYSLARRNNNWLLYRIDASTGSILWTSDPITLAEWTGDLGPIDDSVGPAEPIRREELDQESHTKTPHLLAGQYSLLGCTHQGALICHDLAASTPVEAWRKDGRLPVDDKQSFYLPVGVDADGRFVCAFREITWTETSIEGLVWPNPWNPDVGADLPTATFDFPTPISSVAGLVALDPATGAEVWRWEVDDETGTLREWERRDEGDVEVLQVDDEDWVQGTGDLERREPRLALIEIPPEIVGGREYFRGGLTASGPAIYYNYSGDPPALTEDGSGPAVHLWSNLPHGALPYDAQAGPPQQWEPDLDTVAADTILRQWGSDPAEWIVEWTSLYIGQVPVTVDGGDPPHSLTAACVSEHGIVMGPRSSDGGLDFAGDALVWRCVRQSPESGEGETLWTASIDAAGAGYARLCSAPLCVGDRIYTLVWEYDELGNRGQPTMVVLAALDGEILAVPSEVFSVVGEALTLGFELVFDGSQILARISNKVVAY